MPLVGSPRRTFSTLSNMVETPRRLVLSASARQVIRLFTKSTSDHLSCLIELFRRPVSLPSCIIAVNSRDGAWRMRPSRRSSGIDGRFGFCSLGLGQCCETRISGRHGLDSMILAPTAQFRTASMNFRSYSTERSPTERLQPGISPLLRVAMNRSQSIRSSDSGVRANRREISGWFSTKARQSRAQRGSSSCPCIMRRNQSWAPRAE